MLFTNFEKDIKECRGALHIGANVGEEVSWYARHGFSPVIWFEPNIDLYTKLLENVTRFKGHSAFNVGVHDTLQAGTLHIANNQGQSSSILPLGTHKKHHPKVRYVGEQSTYLIRMDSFFKNTQHTIEDFNFLNIDVQGVELNVIKSFGELINKLDYIYTEVNEEEVYEGCCLIQEIDAYLDIYGFVRRATHMTKHKWGDAFYIKKDLL